MVATAGDGAATISFVPPASDGGSPITGYTVVADPGGLTTTGLASPIAVADLTNGVDYSFTVVASNAVGDGPASAPSNTVTPAPAPCPPVRRPRGGPTRRRPGGADLDATCVTTGALRSRTT